MNLKIYYSTIIPAALWLHIDFINKLKSNYNSIIACVMLAVNSHVSEQWQRRESQWKKQLSWWLTTSQEHHKCQNVSFWNWFQPFPSARWQTLIIAFKFMLEALLDRCSLIRSILHFTWRSTSTLTVAAKPNWKSFCPTKTGNKKKTN